MPGYFKRACTLLACALLFTVSLHAQVTAGFTPDRVSGCVPLIVHFTNTSTGATSYNWNLGNGSTPTITDPVGTYLSAGTYTVTLTAHNGPASSIATTVITVYPLPTVNLAASDTAVCPGEPIAYTQTVTPGVPGPITYNWNFGDGLTDGAAFPLHTFNYPSYFTITLYATNSMGCTSSAVRNNYIHVHPTPVSAYSASPTYLCADGVVNFTNLATGTPPRTYTWDFGDGTTSTVTNPSHFYSGAGPWDVKLVATNTFGCMDSLTNGSFIQHTGLVADFTPVDTVCFGAPTNYYNTSTTHTASEWYFSDGSTSHDDNAIHAFTSGGLKTIKLVVFDGSCTDTTISQTYVLPPYSVDFTVTPAIPCMATSPAGLTCTFTATMPLGSTAVWDFGDRPTTATGNPVTHTYARGYIVMQRLQVTDIHGCISNMSRRDSIPSLLLALNSLYSEGCVPLTTNFNAAIFAGDSDLTTVPGANVIYFSPDTIASYDWNFGDGSPHSTAAMPAHTYTAQGNYVASCTVVTTHGCTKTATYPIRCGLQPTINLTATPAHICSGRTVTLSSTYSTPTPNAWYWDFGDGLTDAGAFKPTVTHRYGTADSFYARLKVLYNGCETKWDTAIVIVDSPTAIMTFNYFCSPANGAAFTSLSLGATSQTWLFGDGGTSTLPAVSHTYAGTSPYIVKLATYNASTGCRDTATGIVNLTPVTVSFIGTRQHLCPGDIDTFSATINEAYTSLKWYVDWVPVDSANNPFYFGGFSPGTHTVSLVVRDFRGCYDTFTRVNYITMSNSVPAYVATASTGCAPFTVTFVDASTAAPGMTNTTITWNFNDGTGLFFGPAVTHVYTAAGTFNVGIMATDNWGCPGYLTVSPGVTVYHPDPIVAAGSAFPCAHDSIRFFNYTPDIASAAWTFGDGGTSTAIEPMHAYTAGGSYTVSVTATDIHGCSGTLSVPLTVSVNPAPYTDFSLSDSFAVCPPLNVNFTNLSIGATSYSWIFGNGGTSIATSPSNPYTAPGLYTVKLAATNALGCTDTAVKHVSVFGYTGAFTYTPLAGCMPLPVHFQVTLGGVSSVAWDFSDGIVVGTSMIDTITHTYTTPGAYVPKLVLTDSTGCTAFSLGADTIKVNKVVPWFRIAPNPVCVNASVSFTDSTYSYFTNTATWSWSFGNGATSTLANPVTTYTAAGVYTVTLTAGNAAGCSASVSRVVTVNPLPGPATGSPAVCVGYNTLLTGSPATGTWSGGVASVAAITAGGLVTGNAAGTTLFTYTLPTGCSAITMVTVLAVPAAITGDSAICQSATTTMGAASTGGTWSSSNPAVASIASATGVLYAATPGTATITYMLGSGCNSTRTITVNGIPGIITGPSLVCNASTATFTTTATGGKWFTSNPAKATIDSLTGTLTGVDTGVVTVSYVLPSGCFGTRITTVMPLPDLITGNPALCHFAATTLANATAGGIWVSTAPAIAAIGTAGNVAGLAPGTATIAYTLSTGCFRSVTVTVNPLPPAISGVLNVCVAATVTLGNVVPGGTWSSSDLTTVTAGLSTGAITGIAAGTAFITYTLPTTCYTTTMVTVLAVPPAIVAPPTVCGGHAINLVNPVPGGVWSSPGAPGIASFNPVTAVITGITPGTITVTYTLFNGCRTSSTFTVNPLPPAIGGIAEVCMGGTTTLTNTVAPGVWSVGSYSVAAIDSFTGMVTGNAPGTATITYTIPTGCYNLVDVTVDALPAVISGPYQVCEQASVALTSSTPGGYWISSTPSVATVSAAGGIGMVQGIAAGTATITYQLFATGCYVTRTMTVHASPPAITGTAHVCIGYTRTLANAVAGGAWNSSNTAIAPVSAGGVVSGMALGTAIISYILPVTGCAATRMVTVQPLPDVFTVGGGGAYCAGGTGVPVSLSASQIGVSYALYYGPSATGYITGTGLPLNFGPMTLAGTYTVQATNPATGCVRNMAGSATVVVTAPSVPAVTITTGVGDSVCPATMVTLTPVAISGGSTPAYVWTVNSIVVSTGASYSYIPADGDIAGVTMTSNAYCVAPLTATAEKVLHVLPMATPAVSLSVSPGDTVCAFTPVSYLAMPLYGGITPAYTWLVNGTASGAGPVFSYVPDDGDVIHCRMISNYLCRLHDTALSGSLTMVVDSLVVPHITITAHPGTAIHTGDTVLFTTAVTGAGAAPQYQWFINGAPVAGATSATYTSHTLSHNDSVSCMLTSSGVCADISAHDWLFMSVARVGVAAVATETDLRLLPNPNNGTCTIKGYWGGNDDAVLAEVTNMLGQVVHRVQLPVAGHRILSALTLGKGLPNGMYIVNFKTPSAATALYFVLEQ